MISPAIISQSNNDGDSPTKSATVIDNSGWISGQYKNYSIRITSGLLETSISNSQTFEKSLVYANANTIEQAHVLKNGNILLVGNNNKIYLTDINLTSVVEKTVFLNDGLTPFAFHTPQNASLPGKYFFTLTQTEQHDETDVYCWGNYGNVQGGATPSQIIYTSDFGQTIKIAYQFGQNPVHRDNGTISGGNTGTLLGDASNPIYCRHIHNLFYDKFSDHWYCLTGDHLNEIYWLKGRFLNGSWTWSVIDFGFQITQQHRLKAVEGFIHDGFIYYGSDTTNVTPPNPESGIWRVPISLVNDLSKHQKVLNLRSDTDVVHGLKVDRDKNAIIFLTTSNSSLAFANTFGFLYDLSNPSVHYIDLSSTNYPLNRLSYKNNLGQYLCDAKQFETLHNRYLFSTL